MRNALRVARLAAAVAVSAAAAVLSGVRYPSYRDSWQQQQTGSLSSDALRPLQVPQQQQQQEQGQQQQ